MSPLVDPQGTHWISAAISPVGPMERLKGDELDDYLGYGEDADLIRLWVELEKQFGPFKTWDFTLDLPRTRATPIAARCSACANASGEPNHPEIPAPNPNHVEP